MYDSNNDNIFQINPVKNEKHLKKDSVFSEEISIAGRTWQVLGTFQNNQNRFVVNSLALLASLLLILVSLLLNKKISKILLFQTRERELNLALENWRHAILESSQFAIIATTKEGIITTFNAAAEHLLGYQAFEVLGLSTPGIFHCPEEVREYSEVLSLELGEDIPAGFETFVAKARLKGFDLREWTYINKSKQRIPVRLSVTAIRDGHEEVIGYLGIAEDLSEIRNMQKNILSSAKMSALGEMAGGVAHEINNPLAIILGRIDIIKRQLQQLQIEPGHKIYQEVEKIEHTGLRIAAIVKGQD